MASNLIEMDFTVFVPRAFPALPGQQRKKMHRRDVNEEVEVGKLKLRRVWLLGTRIY